MPYSWLGKNTKLNKYFLYAIIVSITFIGTTIWVQFALNPQIDTTGASNGTITVFGNTWRIAIPFQTVPTIINGITASTSIIIAFSGAFIGIMFREIFKDDKESKTILLGVLLLFSTPLAYQYVVYTYLALGFLDWALRWSLEGFLLSLTMLILTMILVTRKLDLDKEINFETARDY